MKKLFTVLLIALLSGTISAQDSKLKYQFKADLGFVETGLSFGIAFNKNFAAELSAGYSGTIIECTRETLTCHILFRNNKLIFTPYTKANLKYFYNNKSFVMFQSRYNFKKDDLGSVLINGLSWGQRYDLGKGFLFQYNIGGAYYYNVTNKMGKIGPSAEITFSYVIF